VKGRENELQPLQWVTHSEKENSVWMNEHILTSFRICKYSSGDPIKNGMGGACGMYGGQKRSIQDFGEET